LILNTLHVSEVFSTPIATFEDVPDQQKFVTPTNLQILNQVELVEATCVEPLEEIIDQLVIKG
jgi:hypothetical protein